MDGVVLQGLRVMLVEDELLVSLLIEDILAELLCIVVGPFDSVPAALAAARHEPIDLAILDVNVAGMTTYGVAEVLEARGIPFVIVSGYGRNALPDNHPDWPVCSKPFRTNDLIHALVRQISPAA